jgi:radical SAM superfamily enzyme YgiQ (UPF0313 family)
MNIYWLNPPLSTRSFYCDLSWINFSSLLDNHNWITPIINWDSYKEIEDIIHDIEKQHVDVLMISNYTWNHVLCGKVATIIKQKLPKIIIISGGPNQFHVPDYVDYMCYAMAHGEVFLVELFKQLQKHGKVIAPDFIPYLITKTYKSPITTMRYEFPNKSIIKTKIDYVSEVVAYSKQNNKTCSVVYETSRGCPYSCTYCEWGAGGTAAKVSAKPLECIIEDIELLSILGVREIEIIDPNFGILKRDVDIITKIAECKKKYGYPEKIVMYGLTKNSKQNKEKILDVVFDAALVDFYFMAIQSTDKEVLHNVKRTDIALEDNIQLAEKYKRLYNSSAKVELIMGMPGDTLENFYKELDLFQRIGNWECPRNLLTLLPNTEAYTQEYRDRFKIKTVLVGTMENEEQDMTYFSDSVISKYRSSFELVVETYSYTKEDYKQMFFINRAQRVIGSSVKTKASVELKEWFNKIKTEKWYKCIDKHLTKMVNGELQHTEITVINGKTIEEIVAENV